MWAYNSFFFLKRAVYLFWTSKNAPMSDLSISTFLYNYLFSFLAFLLVVMLCCNCSKQTNKVSDDDLTIMWQTRSEEKLILELFSGRSGAFGGSSPHLRRIREGELFRSLRRKWHHQSGRWLAGSEQRDVQTDLEPVRTNQTSDNTWNQRGRV